MRTVAWSRKESTKLIPVFIQTYNVDTSLLVKKVEDFRSLNEFFYRDINVKKHRPLEPEPGKADKSAAPGLGIMSSMADSHIMVFRPWSKLRGLVVKNKIFTVEAFLGGEETKLEAMGGGMEGGECGAVNCKIKKKYLLEDDRDYRCGETTPETYSSSLRSGRCEGDRDLAWRVRLPHNEDCRH